MSGLRKWTRDNKLAAIAIVIAVVIFVLGAIVTVTVPEIRLRVGLDKPTPPKQPDTSQPTVPSTPSETKPKAERPQPPSIAPIPNPSLPAEKHPTNFAQDNALPQDYRELLVAFTWAGTVEYGKTTPLDVPVWYVFKNDGSVELKCQITPDCPLPRGRWELKNNSVQITFFSNQVQPVTMHEPSTAEGVVKKNTIEGTFQTADGAKKSWVLTRREP